MPQDTPKDVSTVVALVKEQAFNGAIQNPLAKNIWEINGNRLRTKGKYGRWGTANVVLVEVKDSGVIKR